MNKFRLVLVLISIVGFLVESGRADEVPATIDPLEQSSGGGDEDPNLAEFPADDAYWPKEEDIKTRHRI